jgi:hypothetical protein
MSLTRKDVAATVLTALAVLVYIAAHESWNVWLIGSSHRWAAGAMLLLGMVTCSLGQAGKDMATHPTTRLLALVGTLALVFAVWAIATGSLTALSLLAVAIVVLWAGSTVRHAWHPTHRPIPT